MLLLLTGKVTSGCRTFFQTAGQPSSSDEMVLIHETIYADAVIEEREKATHFFSVRASTHNQRQPLPKQSLTTPEELTAKKSGFLPNSCRKIKESNVLFIPLTSLQHDAINSFALAEHNGT